jgi:hypothetical protein
MKLAGENILSKIQDRLILYRHIYPFVQKNKDRVISGDNTICLFCQPRGGSTWLAEIMLHLPGSVLIDEPLWRGNLKEAWGKPDFFERKVPQLADLDFYYNQYIPSDEPWPEASVVFEDILSGRVPSNGLYAEQDMRKLRGNGVYITKFCYGNLLMAWLVKQFNVKAILLTRHPCAVISSQLTHPSWQQLKLDERGKVANFPFNDIYVAAMERVGKIGDRESFLATLWALNFRHTAMQHENNKSWLTISYEGLLLNFDYEIDRIDNRFSLGLNRLAMDHRKPSRSACAGLFGKHETQAQLDSWKKRLSQKQISAILNVLEKFEIEIYNIDSEPDYSRLYKD